LLILPGIAQFSQLISIYTIATHSASAGAHPFSSERGCLIPYSRTLPGVTHALGPLRTGIAIRTYMNQVACSSHSACQANRHRSF
jgi:hypothetical protein